MVGIPNASVILRPTPERVFCSMTSPWRGWRVEVMGRDDFLVAG
jgi:hypothetical protein